MIGRAMKVSPTEIPGVVVVETSFNVDRRGSFARFFCEQELRGIVGARRIVQVNHSRTGTVGAVRGMHFQYPPHAEMKLVRCLKGRAWDVAIDLRADSPTFLRWHGEEITPDNARMLVIPEGCAHGFQVLASDTELLYLHTAFYAPGAEGGVRYDDPKICIDWPIPVTEVSAKDVSHPTIAPGFFGIQL